MNFLESILNLVARCWAFVCFFAVVDQYERGVVLRFGKFARLAEPGLIFYIPFAIERVFTTPVVNQTIRPPHQSLTTKDEVNVVVGGIVRYEVRDVQKFLLEVWETRDVFEDVTAGAIKRIVSAHTWAELHDSSTDTDRLLANAIRQDTSRFGVGVLKATLSDLGKIRSIRLMLDNKAPSESWVFE